MKKKIKKKLCSSKGLVGLGTQELQQKSEQIFEKDNERGWLAVMSTISYIVKLHWRSIKTVFGYLAYMILLL